VSALDPSAPGLPIVSSGGGASLPTTPADALLDETAADTMLGLDGSGVGQALSASAARTRMGLGGAAVLDVGTTAGTVAAGNDSRITGAIQSSTLTTRGDIITRGASAPQRLAIGTSGYVLTSDGTDAVWASPTGTPTWLALYGATGLYVGGESAFGFAQADYVTASAAAAVPAFGPGQSIVACVYPGATPTGVEIVACHASGASNRGWVLDFGRNAGSRRQCGLYLFGMNASAGVQLTGSEFTVGSPYVIAITIKADKSVRYSVNGAAVATISALSGTFAPPTSADTYDFGSTRAFVSLTSYYPLTSALIGQINTYSTELSDADLVAACAGVATGTIPTVATGTISTKFLPSDFVGGVRVKAQTGATWILKAGASIAPK